MNRKIKFYIVGILSLIIIVVAGSLFFVINKDWQENKIHELEIQKIMEQNVEICENIKKIDGLCYSEDEEPFVYAVMIENHVDARPASGLSQASLVYEAIVESPITRFLAVFSSDRDIPEIGPVRSARPFYVDWAKEFNGPYVHVGGSNEALDLIAKTYSLDVNEFSEGKSFWRKWTRRQPHNVYTSTTLLKELFDVKKWDVTNDFESWKFEPEVKSQADLPEQTVRVDFATYAFTIDWKFDQQKNDYLRYQAGAVHEDKDGTEIRAKNVAIMYTESKVIDSYGRRKTKTTGTGTAIVFRGGEAIEGTWIRPSVNARTRFYNSNRNEIVFLPGTTWIEVIPDHFLEVKY
ncbi:DUF3048 domain-containing protein [Candidatus Kuenenbacteria bacterium]|nr:DUF3048 domain-containing protein [Candidatus Kuenenbacteria bacterium]